MRCQQQQKPCYHNHNHNHGSIDLADFSSTN
jgi:hypothetical protein